MIVIIILQIRLHKHQLACGLPGEKTFGLSKVTRQAAQRRRNPFEGKALAKTKTAALKAAVFYWVKLLAPTGHLP
ncbi:TPA: hypothetical protein ACNU2W_000055 [Aeromonas salmonicida subsp. pectinolytica]